MRIKTIALRLVGFVFMLSCVSTTTFADPLVYSGHDNGSLGEDDRVGEASPRVVPVTYSTNYEAQYSPYATFMQSPYSRGGAQQSYSMNSAYPRSVNPAVKTIQDPLQGSEVSPFAHYSPYLEVVGEGSNYTLGIDDIVTIIVREQPDFSGRFIVDPDGNIQYNFVGDIPANGKTKEELKVEIMKRLIHFVRYPEVAVMISEYRSKAIFVFGYVNRPGKYAMKGDKITVKEAVVAAGLTREDASMKRVYIIRPSQYTQDGKATKKKVNLKELIQNGNSAEDFLLEAGDTIVVHQKYFDRFVNSFSKVVGPVFQSAAVYELGWGTPENGLFGKKK